MSAVCASFTPPTEREKVSCTLLPALSVAVTTTSRLGSVSKSIDWPSFSLSWPFTTSKRGSETSKLWLSPASGSIAVRVPMMAPATFSTSVLPERSMSTGASFTSPTLMVKVLAIWLPALSVAVTVTSTVGSLSWSSDTPSFSLSWPSTISNRSSETW